jgi:general secretion pathway protein K
MLLVRGVTPDIFYGTREREGIAPYLTVYGTHELNINTAPIPVLMALSADMSEDLAADMDKFRKDEKNDAELTSSAWYRRIWPYANPLPEKYLTVHSDTFTVRIKVSFGTSEKEIRAVLKRPEGRAEVIYWQEL